MMNLASYRTLFFCHAPRQRLRVDRYSSGVHLRQIGATIAEPRPAKIFACLVDAENTQPSKLAAVVAKLNGYGQVIVRRLYGDFSRPDLHPWKKVSNELSFRPHTQFAIISGKGSSDMAMAIDAISILHDDKINVEGFALVSSDSDFTPLASKLRESGNDVIGFGLLKTPDPFVKACSKFFYLENLSNNKPSPPKPANKTTKQPTTIPEDASLISELVTELHAALTECRKSNRRAVRDEGWVDLNSLDNMLRRRNPSWTLRNYGIPKSKGYGGLLERPDVQKYFELKKVGRIKFLRARSSPPSPVPNQQGDDRQQECIRKGSGPKCPSHVCNILPEDAGCW